MTSPSPEDLKTAIDLVTVHFKKVFTEKDLTVGQVKNEFVELTAEAISTARAEERERCAQIAEDLVLPIDWSGLVQTKAASAIRGQK